MHKRIILVIIVAIVIISGVIVWWLFGMQPQASQEPSQQEEASEVITTITGKCALVEGTPTYTYEISESAVVDATYEVFDDTKEGERGLLPGGESIFWTTVDPEIVIIINDGEPQTIIATSCDVSEDFPKTSLKIKSSLSEIGTIG